jgi:hypothetical protein
MVTTLIVLGVVAFVAVDAYVIYRVLRARRSADDHGALAVPGEVGVTLPVGRLKLTYQESYRAGRSGDSIDFGVPGGLAVVVTSPAGEQLEIKGPGFRGMGASLSTGRGWSRALIGTVEIAQPGEHMVSAGPELPEAVEPQILLGK